MNIQRDEEGYAHIVALSGGKDSTALALHLKEIEDHPYTYVCSPTGDELPDMIDHWKRLMEMLEAPLHPVSSGVSLNGLIKRFNALPNHRMRWCTRILKIEPFQAMLLGAAPAYVYVGLRADEEEREGAVYPDINDVIQRYPLREWGWGLKDVIDYLASNNIIIPVRTDCARCYAQTLGEWWNLWMDNRPLWEEAVGQEESIGRHFRSDQRDTWPARLKLMGERFEHGDVPTLSKTTRHQLQMFDDHEEQRGRCRVCTL